MLDESVIPRKYARVLLNAVYQDSVDLSLILRGSASMCSLSEAQAIVAGKGQMTLVDEAMEVYQIGQFLDFPILSQGMQTHTCKILLHYVHEGRRDRMVVGFTTTYAISAYHN